MAEDDKDKKGDEPKRRDNGDDGKQIDESRDLDDLDKFGPDENGNSGD